MAERDSPCHRGCGPTVATTGPYLVNQVNAQVNKQHFGFAAVALGKTLCLAARASRGQSSHVPGTALASLRYALSFGIAVGDSPWPEITARVVICRRINGRATEARGWRRLANPIAAPGARTTPAASASRRPSGAASGNLSSIPKGEDTPLCVTGGARPGTSSRDRGAVPALDRRIAASQSGVWWPGRGMVYRPCCFKGGHSRGRRVAHHRCNTQSKLASEVARRSRSHPAASATSACLPLYTSTKAWRRSCMVAHWWQRAIVCVSSSLASTAAGRDSRQAQQTCRIGCMAVFPPLPSG
jgi:hypothetical protein